MRKEYRHETKYCTQMSAALHIQNILMSNGIIRSYPSRTVSSVYYDSVYYRSLVENLSGQSDRSKFRLRWYVSPDQNHALPVNLENKIKRANVGFKSTLFIGSFAPDLSVSQLCVKASRGLRSMHAESAIFSDLSPQHITVYERQYFEDSSGVRATIDTGLRFSIDFESTLASCRASRFFNDPIIEIKYPQSEFHRVSRMLQSFPVPSCRCSKYVLGQSLLKGFCYL